MAVIVGPRTVPGGIPALGSYSISQASGQIVATGAANAVLWTCRWVDAANLALIERIRVSAVVQSTITTAVPYDMSMFFSRAYTVAPTTSITPATMTTNNQKRRTNMSTSLFASAGAGIFVLTTVAAGITGQTFVNDAQELARIEGNSGTVVGTQYFGANPAVLWDSNSQAGGYPIVLAANEGITIQAPFAGPATGTFSIMVDMDWSEVASF